MDPAALNKMLEGRIKDLASLRRGSSKDDLDARRECILKALGLSPLPPRTDLKAAVTGTIARDGYRIEKLRYESRPDLLVTAHLYIPEGHGPFPLIVSSHGVWKGKKAAPVVQARGISFALRGFAVLIVDAPGSFGNDLSLDERGGIGAPADPALVMGAPWIGQYVWDLMRGIEACIGRTDVDAQRIGVTGEGDGGIAALATFVVEPRIGCAALVCTAPSMEQKSLESMAQLAIPGIALAGDFSDMLAVRSPAPVMLVGALEDDRFSCEDVKRTAEKLTRTQKTLRFEQFEGGTDYNRRMRESVAAFFCEHLMGSGPHLYLPELRPLTDGVRNPYPAGTVPQEDPSLLVTEWPNRQTMTFLDVLDRNLSEPHPEPFKAEDRLAPWNKFGGPGRIDTAVTIGIHDSPGTSSPKNSPSIALPIDMIDSRLAALAGLSVAEFLAQILHLHLPGRPMTWESEALSGDGLSAMIASVKTLVKSAAIETIPGRVVAEGPVASLTASFLKLYRPALEIETTQTWKSWDDLRRSGIPQIMQPQARYLDWPFG